MSQGNDRCPTRQDVTNHNKIHSDQSKPSSGSLGCSGELFPEYNLGLKPDNVGTKPNTQGHNLPQNAALLNAWYEYGCSKKVIAGHVDVSPQTISLYFHNRTHVPHQHRRSLDRAFAADVDWPWYERCYKAARAVIECRRAKKRPSTAKTQSLAPQRPETAPKINGEGEA